jgi:hypothetical protein
MPFIGNTPAQVPLTSADIADGIITSAKIVDGTIVNADINASAAIASTKLSGITSPAAFRNIVINGDMQVAQRSTSVASISSGNTYNALDRFRVDINSLGTWTMSQSTDVPSGYGFSNSLKMDCTTADASPAAGDVLLIQTRFEGQNLQYLKKGTANAQSLTLSFWVKSTKTGTFICNLIDDTNARLNAQSYTVSVSNTWEFKTVTFPADTTGTLANTNGSGLSLSFWLGAGTDFTSGTLQTTWASTVNTNRAVGQVNCADSTSNDWLITGVQLEAGTSATDFEFLPIDVSKKRCKRYFQKTTTGIYRFQGSWIGLHWSGTAHIGSWSTDTELRTDSTVAYAGSFQVLGGGSTAAGYTPSGGNQHAYGWIQVTMSGTQRASDQTLTCYSENASTFISFDAEL